MEAGISAEEPWKQYGTWKYYGNGVEIAWNNSGNSMELGNGMEVTRK